MDNWQKDLLEAMSTARDDDGIEEKLQSAARHLGFDYWAYGLRCALPVSKPHEALLSNYPSAWKVRYAEQGYLRVDPTEHVKVVVAPFMQLSAAYSVSPRHSDR